MTVSHQIGEALWAEFKPKCPDLSLKVELDPDIRAYRIRMRTAMFSRPEETYYVCTVAMKSQGLGPLVAEVYDEINRDLLRQPSTWRPA